MILTYLKKSPIELEINESFPFFRSKTKGEEGFGDYEKTFWKFESINKVSIITETMSQVIVKTLYDPTVNYICEIASEEMLEGTLGFDKEDLRSWQRMTQRLINQIHEAI